MVDTLLAGRYRLETEIAAGGMATVWRAGDLVLGRKVAVKILHRHLADDEVLRERFRLEALAAAPLTHANIVSIFDTGEHEGSPYIVMEYLGGGTLAELLAERGALDPERVATVGADVCNALAYAHRAGVVHRDVKPANIMFSESGHLKVVDFGIAKAALGAVDLTTTGTILGTLRYVAPEVVEGKDPDFRADLYSLAVVLFQCATGRPPFPGESELASAMARLEKDPPRARDIRPDIPRELDAVIARALARSPEARFADAGEMGGVLRAVAGDDEAARVIAAAPPTVQVPVPAPETSFLRSEGRWLLPTVLLLAAASALVFAVVRFAPDVPFLRRQPAFEQGAGGAAVEIRGAGTFDPGGDGEKEDLVPRAFDGNRRTAWRTQSYTRADLGGLKPGVGIWFDMGDPAALRSVRVVPEQPGFSATIRHSDDGRTWSEPGPSETVQGDHDFTVTGEHRYWMVWVTGLARTGEGRTPFSAGIAEIEPRRA